MPRKLRELRSDLRREGWAIARQRGSHQTWRHPLVPFPVILLVTTVTTRTIIRSVTSATPSGPR